MNPQSPSFRLKDVSIRTKLLAATLLLTGIMVVISGVGIWGMSQIQSNLNLITNQQIAKIRIINAMRLDYANFSGTLDLATVYENADQQKQTFAQGQQYANTLIADTNTFLASPHRPEEIQDVAFIKKTIPSIVQTLQPFFVLAQQNISAAIATLKAAINQPQADTQAFVDLQNTFDHLLANLNGYVRQIRADSDASFHTLLATMIAFAALGAVLSFAIGLFVTNMIVKPLDAAVQAVRAIAQGDLRSLDGFTHRYGGKDAFGQLTFALADMVGGLRGLIANIQQTVRRFSNDALQITTAAQQTTQATEQVAQTVQQVAADAAHQSHELAEVAHQVDELGTVIAESRSQAQATAQSMQTLNENNQSTAQIVKRLGDRSAEIGQIIETITEIAEQTNLLALNAAIEAARAGEQGRGFAVVADEVRKLAERSTNATREISTIVREVQQSTQNTVEVIESGVAEMGQGVERTVATSRVLEVITSNSQQINSSIAQVAHISEQTSSSSEAVSAAIEEISAQMVEATAVTQNLAQVAQELQQSIAQFQIDDEAFSGTTRELSSFGVATRLAA
jgi:methyl-accepting chemotaxis protein